MSVLRTAVAEGLAQAQAAWRGRAPSMAELNDVLRLLGKWRAQALAETFLSYHGAVIRSGPFAGMEYVAAASEGALIARLLGTYESELHPHIEAIAARGLDGVIDVGCAEGYYAVGLARQLGIPVHAHDILERARDACATLASRNGVSDRVIIGGEFAPEDFQAFAGRRMLVLVDTEGAELGILDPVRGPALAAMSIIVETHDGYTPNALSTLVERFSATHDILHVDQGPKVYEQPPWLAQLSHLDQLLATWEWRAFPTPWLVMTPKAA